MSRFRTDYSAEWAKSFWQRVEVTADGCWGWSGVINSTGRPVLSPTIKRKVLAARYSYWLHNGEIPDGKVICHRCDNPKCVNPAHLFAGSQADNMADMTAKGRRVGTANRGDANGRAKIRSADILAIADLKKHRDAKDIAAMFGVSVSTINRAAKRVSQ